MSAAVMKKHILGAALSLGVNRKAKLRAQAVQTIQKITAAESLHLTRRQSQFVE
jgi:hypothetical protein